MQRKGSGVPVPRRYHHGCIGLVVCIAVLASSSGFFGYYYYMYYGLGLQGKNLHSSLQSRLHRLRGPSTNSSSRYQNPSDAPTGGGPTTSPSRALGASSATAPGTSPPPPPSHHRPHCFRPGDDHDAIAVTGHRDGFGACYSAQLQALALARHTCKHYVFIPFQRVSHNQDAQVMNRFCGLTTDEDVTNRTRVKTYQGNVDGRQHSGEWMTAAVRAELLSLYRSTPKPDEDCPYDVAIHIRRGDVIDTANMEARWIDDWVYAALISDWLYHCPDASIAIYSEGQAEQFRNITHADGRVRLVLNGDLRVTYHHLVTAPVLVVAHSAFSVSAGLLNPNRIIYPGNRNSSELPGGTEYVRLGTNQLVWDSNMRWC
mmetsp:Transcript_28620/g.63630  ORF Transcript_28620/g.63630 Transcript_28620/m.63630 type:complete len:372 (-) Transcript_28620:150-1265(-)